MDTTMEVEEGAVIDIEHPVEQHDHSEGQPVADDGEAELYFLIAHALSGGPLAHIGETLVGEASARGLLPARIDYTGQRHPVPYSHLRDRYSHLPHGALRQGLQDLLQYRRAELQAISGRNVSSILDPAVLPGPSALPSFSSLATRPPLWSLTPFSTKRNGRGLPRPNLTFLRETGIAAGSSGGLGGQEFLSPQSYSQLLHHHFSVRGHSVATYCIMFDKTGSYIITGSDDRLVKVYAVGTGLLKCTCRGHDGEISDLSVSCDNTMFASSSIDFSIRVWRLLGDAPVPLKTSNQRTDGSGGSGPSSFQTEAENINITSLDAAVPGPATGQENQQQPPRVAVHQTQIGTPISVLMGHTQAITGIDFSPNQPHILVSTSFDGTARVWDVRDGAIAPLILYSHGAGMGPGGGGGTDLPRALLEGPGGAGGGARTTRHSERRQVATAINLSRGAGTGAGAGAAGVDANGAGPSQQPQEGDGRTRRRGTVPLTQAPSQSASSDSEPQRPGLEEALRRVVEDDADSVPAHSMLACSFTRDGRYIVSGSNDCCVYVWRWQKPAGVVDNEGKTTATAVDIDQGPSTSKSAAAAAVVVSPTAAAEAPFAWPRIDVSNFKYFLSFFSDY
jgi:WD40 repeat protein